MNFVKCFEYAKKIGFSDVEFKVQTSNKLSISVFQKKKAELQRSYVLGPRSHK